VRILLAGASGFLGTRLARRLRGSGHTVVRLVRREPADVEEVRWDPAAGRLDPATFAGVDAVINLAGAGIGAHRWTDRYKKELRDSRVGTTATLATTIAGLPTGQRPATLLNASGIHFYGDTGDRVVDESAGPGTGFLAEMCQEWEGATAPAADAGLRVVLLRTAPVLAHDGEFLKPQLLPFRLGLGARLGDGRQYWAWISLRDWLAAVDFLLDGEVAGPVNLTGPEPATNAEFTRALARAVGRPAVLRVPSAALRIGLGEFATAALASIRALPAVLTDRGFGFAHPTVDAALSAVLPDRRRRQAARPPDERPDVHGQRRDE
jgi:uncharacterized protein